MSSVQNLRDFILQRLSAAAEEIFSLFQKTIEEEMERQRRLLDVSWRPEAHLGGTELSDRFLRKEQEEEELPANQQIWPRGAESGSDQDADLQAESGRRDPATIWTDDSESAGAPEVETKKRRSLSSGPAGFWNSQEEDRPVLKQEADDPTTSDGGPSDGGPSDGALAKPRFQEGCRIDTSGSAALKSEDERIRRRNGGGAALQSELRPVSCDVCGKAFRCNSDMRVHYRVHTGEKPFSCSVCQRAFSLKANLAVHMRTHTGEKPYSCQFCQKGFSDHSSLRKHINVHTGERPYSCAVCGRRFSRSSHMWRHARVHAAEAPPR